VKWSIDKNKVLFLLVYVSSRKLIDLRIID